MDEGTEVLRKEVMRYCETYLFDGLVRAGEADEDPNVMLFALFECIHRLLTNNYDTRDEAIAALQSNVQSFINDWKSAPPHVDG